jgi:Uma2 family endonuclease
MATATLIPAPESLTIPPESVYQLSVEQYHQMADAGVLTTADRVELIEGILVKRMTISPLHTFVTQKFTDLMNELLAGWYARTQQPITLGDSEPEPDGSVVRGRGEDYRTSHPAVPDIGIVFEAADRSLAFDRGRKKRMYASNGVAVYWIANLKEKVIELYAEPAGNDYGRKQVFRLAESVPVELEGKVVGEIRVAALFGESNAHP